MDPKQLKQAIAEDMKTIKMLNPEIIPARFYYGGLLKGVFNGVWRMSIILFLTLCYVMSDDKEPISFSSLFIDSGITALFLSIVAMLILLTPISFFVQFQFHLEKKLKTSALIRKKCNHISMVFFGMFAFLCILFGSYVSGQQIFFMLVVSFFLSLGATHIAVHMELSRIGFSSLFTLCNEFFSKGKTVSIEEAQK
ncbi:TPA: hypothetical protein JAJ32_002854 [Legionella pneumophila]|nr:hypothetical protein [Legionella pneumophila]HCC3258024.1 hypothetical protein [Legionella pneumophila subsp. pneumophila]HAT1812552.1 hypothetical protein [Legionella pneumophila]HAT1874719.1 hypothetical protein [Legionella pneumophila]HAT3873762.1 hypothetical protein [Legionella pneumophila]HAT6311236.1 hypothetical protein [Legionella pneumophila]